MRSLPFRAGGRVLGTAVCAVSLGLSAACGGAPAPAASSAASSAASAPAAPDAAAASRAAAEHAGMGHAEGHAGHGSGAAVELYAVQTGTLGVVVTDGEGRLLYGSDQDGNDPPASHCTGGCTQEWLPLVVPAGQEPDLLGVTPDKVGRLARDDGSSQLTLGGWPVYVNKDDDGALKSAAPDAHGAWFVMTPEGQKVDV